MARCGAGETHAPHREAEWFNAGTYCSCAWTPAAKEAASSARKAVKRKLDAAKAKWVRETNGAILSPDSGQPVTPKMVRDAIRLLSRGPNARKEGEIVQLYKDRSAGSGRGKFTTPEENREMLAGSLQKAFSQVGTFDPTAVVKLRQRAQQLWIYKVPSAA